jgi:Chaperone for flagella basal body P-ring formation
MKNLRLQSKHITIFLFLLLAELPTNLIWAICYDTPRAAIEAIDAKSLFSQTVESRGYRVMKIQSDPLIGKRWAMIADCGHPEWPAFALGIGSFVTPKDMNRTLAELLKPVPVVHAGDVVRLWRQEKALRIEVAGISEESGGLGSTIRVRRLRSSAEDQSTQQQFSGIVRGPSNVEIQP